VDGCYWLYWRWKDPAALELMRDVNAAASLCLYWMCGLVWYFHGLITLPAGGTLGIDIFLGSGGYSVDTSAGVGSGGNSFSATFGVKR
jgi:hypothetical protein